MSVRRTLICIFLLFCFLLTLNSFSFAKTFCFFLSPKKSFDFLSCSRSIAFNQFSKTVRNTRVSRLFYIIVQVAREDLIGRGEEKKNRRKKTQQNRKQQQDVAEAREISGFGYFFIREFLETSFFRWRIEEEADSRSRDCYRFARVRRGTGIDRSRLEVEWRFFQF